MLNGSSDSDAEAAQGRSRVTRRGSYYGWTVVDLRKHAKDFGMKGYSRLSKDQLITALRDH